jgi:hypothetical protein
VPSAGRGTPSSSTPSPSCSASQASSCARRRARMVGVIASHAVVSSSGSAGLSAVAMRPKAWSSRRVRATVARTLSTGLRVASPAMSSRRLAAVSTAACCSRRTSASTSRDERAAAPCLCRAASLRARVPLRIGRCTHRTLAAPFFHRCRRDAGADRAPADACISSKGAASAGCAGAIAMRSKQ